MLNKSEIENILFSSWSYYLYYDAIENKAYICNYDYDKWSALHINKIIEKGKSMPDKHHLHI